MDVFKKLLKNPGIRNALIMAVFYQIMFVSIFMYGYSAMPKNIDQLNVAIVNEDNAFGKKMVTDIGEKLPFKTVSDLSLANAKEKLNDRDVHLVIHIPKNFSEQLTKEGEKAKIDYFVSESNPAFVAQSMEQVSTEITNSMNQALTMQSTAAALEGFQLPKEQAEKLAANLSTKLESNIVKVTTVPAGMHHQMAPFFLTMVSYIGAMVYSMITGSVLNAVKACYGKWKSFWSLQIINISVAILTPMLGIIVYFLISGGFEWDTFIKMCLTHSLEMFTAVQFMTIFVLLLGQKAMFINLPLMISQTISSGAMMTQDMMPGLFKAISYISIMFYTVQVDFSVLFGGGKIAYHIMGLGIIMIVSFLIVMLVHKLLPMKKPAEHGSHAA